MEINSEIRERIIAAAKQLFEDAGRVDFPTVDAVRKLAKVNMNDASVIMKEWRRMQTTAPAVATVAIPDRLRQAHDAALTALWTEAQEIANEALKAAQVAWDAERVEAETLRAELSSAFEAQAIELAAAQDRAAEIEAKLHEVQTQSTSLSGQLDVTRHELTDAINHADRSGARAAEIERRADDLRAELDRAHQDTDQARKDAASASQVLTAEIDQLRHDLAKTAAKAELVAEQHSEQRKRAAEEAHKLAERMTKAEADRDEARKATALAREDAAALRGQLEAIQSQHTELMRILAEREKPSKKS